MKLYNVVRHSSCFEAVENGLTPGELQILTDHKDHRDLQHYYEISASKQSIIQQRAGIACGWEPKLVSGEKE